MTHLQKAVRPLESRRVSENGTNASCDRREGLGMCVCRRATGCMIQDGGGGSRAGSAAGEISVGVCA
jgi:hypothetical protein